MSDRVRAKLSVQLEIVGEYGDPQRIVQNLIEEGVFEEAINYHHYDHSQRVHVTSVKLSSKQTHEPVDDGSGGGGDVRFEDARRARTAHEADARAALIEVEYFLQQLGATTKRTSAGREALGLISTKPDVTIQWTGGPDVLLSCRRGYFKPVSVPAEAMAIMGRIDQWRAQAGAKCGK